MYYRSPKEHVKFLPFSNETSLRWSSIVEAEAKVTVTNLAGEKVREYLSLIEGGTINIGKELPRGFFIVNIETISEKRKFKIYKN